MSTRLVSTLLVLVLTLAATGCANALVAAEGAIHRSIAVTQDTANAACDTKLVAPEACRTFNVRLVPVIVAAKQFNRAVKEDSAAELPAMLAALIEMRNAALELLPPGMTDAVRARIDATWSLVAGLQR